MTIQGGQATAAHRHCTDDTEYARGRDCSRTHATCVHQSLGQARTLSCTVCRTGLSRSHRRLLPSPRCSPAATAAVLNNPGCRPPTRLAAAAAAASCLLTGTALGARSARCRSAGRHLLLRRAQQERPRIQTGTHVQGDVAAAALVLGRAQGQGHGWWCCCITLRSPGREPSLCSAKPSSLSAGARAPWPRSSATSCCSISTCSRSLRASKRKGQGDGRAQQGRQQHTVGAGASSERLAAQRNAGKQPLLTSRATRATHLRFWSSSSAM